MMQTTRFERGCVIGVLLLACSSKGGAVDPDAGPAVGDGGTSDAGEEPPPSCPADNRGPGSAPDGTIPGALTFPHPTLRHATILWVIDGDANANGEVTVRYRAQGTTAWRRAMPLRRAPAGVNDGFAWTDRHAGSVFDLEPATTYELELFLLDPDGGCALRTETVTTRAVPAPMAGAPVKTATPANLGTVLQGALPGDVIELDGGTYAGFTMPKDGTAAAPIVIRARAGATARIEGDVVVSGRSHVHVTGLTVNGRIRLNASTAITVTRNVVTAVGATGNGIDAALAARDSYIADNVVTGQTVWTEAALGVDGDNLGEGIRVSGPGHVVEHNRVSGFRDCLSTLEPGAGGVDLYALDFIANDLENCADDGIEADYCEHDCRVIGNRFTNVFHMASSQPGYGGPTYFIRNAGYNVILSAFKLHNGTIGDVLLHNTIVKNGNAFHVAASVPFARQYARNNIFIGGPGGTYNTYANGSGRVVHLPYADPSGDYDHDGYGSTAGAFTGQIGSATFTSLAELRATTTEKHAIELDLAVFAAAVAYPANPFPAKPRADLRLAPGGVALDVGAPIPNVNDGFSGAGPDLGAYEAGAPLPAYGPR